MALDTLDTEIESEAHYMERGLETETAAPTREKKPFPKFQLAILFLIKITEPINSTVIYPFINQLVRDTGITGGDEAKTGYYAGVIESIFFFSECLSVYHWGRLSDRIGRRPVLLIGPFGLALAMTSFGLSHNFWAMVVSRLAQGVFNGNVEQSHQVLLPLMMSTSIPLGGLGFDSFTIGIVMGTWGIANATFQIVAFSRVVKWLGPRNTYIFCFTFFLTTFGGYPLMSIFAKSAGRADARVWAVLVVQLSLHCLAYISYACIQLITLDAAPGNAALGAVNGLGQVMGATARTLAPTIASSLFSVSLQKQLVGGYMGSLQDTPAYGMDRDAEAVDRLVDESTRPKRPYPVLQLTIIWLIQFTEPVSNTVIYPFINQFVGETGITRGDETKTGYYAGIIVRSIVFLDVFEHANNQPVQESAFFFAECLSVYHWGRLSDKIGRRPVLILGPLGLFLSMLAFGLSQNFWLLVISRCAQGVFNGNIGAQSLPHDVPSENLLTHTSQVSQKVS
ncbi:hypothetical protein H0H81_004184 [Sphagnurus paluster]|uniref:Major facilitator superfamily (MFS) profile domain-containing protein n=1 Tax=Sphagnurus paluster TaxID=117069 RepID=A0A9P7FSY1_9AGAR|nr:hypothetical protein H0H81_004184 [Sphagnurus paluster]